MNSRIFYTLWDHLVVMLISGILSHINSRIDGTYYMKRRALLAPLNDDVNKINESFEFFLGKKSHISHLAMMILNVIYTNMNFK